MKGQKRPGKTLAQKPFPSIEDGRALWGGGANQAKLHHEFKVVANCTMLYYFAVGDPAYVHFLIREAAPCRSNTREIPHVPATHLRYGNDLVP